MRGLLGMTIRGPAASAILVLVLLSQLAAPSFGALRRLRAARASGNHSVGVGNATAQAATAQAPRPPRVYFLFLAVDKVSNLDIWNAFFATAPQYLFRAYVHCKFEACHAQLLGTQLVAVPTVPSYYCTDLVSPMNQLLAVALQNDAASKNGMDKFAFVSDSTLPAKPFAFIYDTYTKRTGSDFCLFPSNEWADVPAAGGIEIAMKHHQWLTLERSHAERASKLWAQGTGHDFMTRFGMNAHQYTWANNTFADSRNFGCLDEFWHALALFGPLTHSRMANDKNVPLSLFTGAPILVSPTAGWQGACDTFVMWSKYLHIPGKNPFSKFHASLDPPSVPHAGNQARPGWWDQISRQGISAIRNSDFIFVRKFVDKPWLVDGGDFLAAYKELVFAK